jgi:ketosteroid isomerase-like protein
MPTPLALRLAAALLLAALIGGCRPTPTPTPAPTPEMGGSCILSLPPDIGGPEAIRAVLQAEGEFVVRQDIDHLMQLWTEDAVVADAKNTPADGTDDQRWEGKDAIRHRYVRTVFPGAPASVQPADLDIQIDEDHAQVTATTQIGAEVSPAGDLWQLHQVDGCWLIASLTYNLEAGK